MPLSRPSSSSEVNFNSTRPISTFISPPHRVLHWSPLLHDRRNKFHCIVSAIPPPPQPPQPPYFFMRIDSFSWYCRVLRHLESTVDGWEIPFRGGAGITPPRPLLQNTFKQSFPKLSSIHPHSSRHQPYSVWHSSNIIIILNPPSPSIRTHHPFDITSFQTPPLLPSPPSHSIHPTPTATPNALTTSIPDLKPRRPIHSDHFRP